MQFGKQRQAAYRVIQTTVDMVVAQSRNAAEAGIAMPDASELRQSCGLSALSNDMRMSRARHISLNARPRR